MAIERFNRVTVNVGTAETVVLNAIPTGDSIVITGRASTTSGTEQTLTLFINNIPVQTAQIPVNDTATLDGDKLVLKAGDVLSATSTGDVDVYVAVLEREGGAGSADAAATAANTAVQARDVATAQATAALQSANAAAASSTSAAASAATAFEYASGGLVRVSAEDTGLGYLPEKLEAQGKISLTPVSYSGNQKLAINVDLSDYALGSALTAQDTTLRTVISDGDAAVLSVVNTNAATAASATAAVDARVDTVIATAAADKAELQTSISNVDAKIAPAVQAGIDSVIGVAPAALDTLAEIAAAINDDANYAATITAELATKVATTTYEAGLATKADAASVYTQAQTNTLVTNEVTTAVNNAIATERTTTQGEVADLQSQIDSLSASITTLQSQIATINSTLTTLQNGINTNASNLQSEVSAINTTLATKAPLNNPAFTGTVTCTGDIIAFF